MYLAEEVTRGIESEIQAAIRAGLSGEIVALRKEIAALRQELADSRGGTRPALVMPPPEQDEQDDAPQRDVAPEQDERDAAPEQDDDGAEQEDGPDPQSDDFLLQNMVRFLDTITTRNGVAAYYKENKGSLGIAARKVFNQAANVRLNTL